MRNDRTVRRCDECDQLYEERSAIELELVSHIDTTPFGGSPSFVIERKPMLVCPDCLRRIAARSQIVK